MNGVWTAHYPFERISATGQAGSEFGYSVDMQLLFDLDPSPESDAILDRKKYNKA